MNLTFINIQDIFKKHREIMETDKSTVFIFYILPIIGGLISSLLFFRDSDKILNVLTLFLSIFIPIFINLLATIISFVMNKLKTRHNKERIDLIQETFYNICYLIPISLALLALSLFMHLTYGKGIKVPINLCFFTLDTTLYRLYYSLIGIFFYGGIIHLVLNILMISKRIFILFGKEIILLSNDNDENQKSKDPNDINALDGEE